MSQRAIDLIRWHVTELAALLKRCQTDEKGIGITPPATVERIRARLQDATDHLEALRGSESPSKANPAPIQGIPSYPRRHPVISSHLCGSRA